MKFHVFQRTLIAASLLACAAPCLAQLDVWQAYQNALQYDATFAAAKSALKSAEEKVVQARSATLPSVNFSANGANVQQEVVNAYDRNYKTAGATLSASYPLWRPANREALSQAQLSLRIAQATFSNAKADLIVRTAQAYFDVLQAQDNLSAINAQKAAISEQLAQAKREFEVGTKTILDTHETQARFDQTVAQEAVAQGDLLAKRSALAIIVGADVSRLAGLIDKPVILLPSPNDASAWVARAEEAAIPVQIAQLSSDIAKIEIDKARSGEGPALDLTSSYNATRNYHGSSSGAASSTVKTGSIGLNFTMPLYAGGALSSRVRDAAFALDKAKSDLDAARRNAGQSARQAYLGTSYGVTQVKALESAERSALTLLDSTKLGYQVGVRINLDVLNAQQSLINTRKDLTKARIDALMASLRLKSAAAQLAEEDLQATNRVLNSTAPKAQAPSGELNASPAVKSQPQATKPQASIEPVKQLWDAELKPSLALLKR